MGEMTGLGLIVLSSVTRLPRGRLVITVIFSKDTSTLLTAAIITPVAARTSLHATQTFRRLHLPSIWPRNRAEDLMNRTLEPHYVLYSIFRP
jgi:hypothetical protein